MSFPDIRKMIQHHLICKFAFSLQYSQIWTNRFTSLLIINMNNHSLNSISFLDRDHFAVLAYLRSAYIFLAAVILILFCYTSIYRLNCICIYIYIILSVSLSLSVCPLPLSSILNFLFLLFVESLVF